ncbi:MAG: beta-propeller fold lactonase family protein [Terriglobales bacterium]
MKRGLGIALASGAAALAMTLLSAVPPHAQASAANSGDQYLSPSEMAFSPDGRLLYVVCERSDQLLVLNASQGVVVQRIRVGHVPRTVAVSPNGRQVFVTNSWDDTISVIDAATIDAAKSTATRTIATQAEPYGLVVDHGGKTLYVANRIDNDVSLIDIATGVERKRLTAGHGSSYLAISADGRRVYCTHVYPRIVPQRRVPQSEVTVIDTASEAVAERIPLDGVAGMFHVALSADGRLGVVAQMRPKNLVPLAHVEHGWVFGHSLTVFGADAGGTIEVPLDELEHYYSLPYGVAIAPDKSRIFVTASGSDVVTVIDTKRLLAFAHSRRKPFVNDLSASANYVRARIVVGRNPRGVAMSPNGRRLYVANRMDDTLSVIDTLNDRSVGTVDLGGGAKTISAARRGEQIFTTSRYAFQGQFSCANCHIDSTFDGLTWDLEPDGFGKDIVDNRLIEDLAGTEPFKWNGGNPSMATECGPRTEMYFYRSQSYSPPELADLVDYIYSLPPRPNRFRASDGQLTAAQERGKAIFYRQVNKFGKAIPEANQCAYCHSGPKHTSQKGFDVGTGKWTDRSPVFDTPQLVNIALTAPYLHDESASSLEEIWTVFNPHDQHGATNDLTKDELNDLVEYLKTL